LARMMEFYNQNVVPRLMKEMGYKNKMEVPKLDRIVVNVGAGYAIQNPKFMDEVVMELTAITGQRPVVTKARMSIANFKLREGMKIGAMVTLRGKRMYYFLDKFINIVLPRVRDFRGVPTKSFDGRGNYTLGLKEQLIFPEVNYDKVERVYGLNVTFVTTARSDKEAMAFLKEMGLPFKK
jgi:large subunit ribosomal protein L5